MKRKKKSWSTAFMKDGLVFRLAILGVSLILLLAVIVYRDELKRLSGYGYIGIFVINFVSAATIFIPAPGTASVFIGGAVWNPFLVGIISGVASAIGELFSYFLGYGGRGVLATIEREGKWVKILEEKFHRRGFSTTLLFSIIPMPVFDIIGVIAGGVNYPVGKFFMATIIGRVIRNIAFALTGAKIL